MNELEQLQEQVRELTATRAAIVKLNLTNIAHAEREIRKANEAFDKAIVPLGHRIAELTEAPKW